MKFDEYEKAKKCYGNISDFKKDLNKFESLKNNIEKYDTLSGHLKIEMGDHNSHGNVKLSKDIAKEAIDKQIYRIKNLISRERKIIDNL